MRFTTVGIAAALTLLSVGTALQAQRADDQIDPRSIALLERGKAAKAQGNFDAATDALESALVLDPRNRQAYIVLAELARQRNLPGKAIRFYREALTLEPNDVAALRGQGEALVQRGAVARARENLTRIQQVCGQSCADATALAAVIQRGPPPQATAAARPVTPPAAPAPKAN